MEDGLAQRFEEQRPRLRAIAYRMLGSLSDADDAVQETWMRMGSGRAAGVDNLNAWTTTVLARICLNMLRARRARQVAPLDAGLPDPVITAPDSLQPEEQALLADSVGLALLVVLERLTPTERLAFVLHDAFEFPFDEIAPILDRTPEAARQLASRARRRVHEAAIPEPDRDPRKQRQVVHAFFRAARVRDFEALVKILHPDVVLRSDFGTTRAPRPPVLRGAQTVARQAITGGALPATQLYPVLVNGSAGVLVTTRGRPFALLAFTVSHGVITAIDAIVDSQRLRRLTTGLTLAEASILDPSAL